MELAHEFGRRAFSLLASSLGYFLDCGHRERAVKVAATDYLAEITISELPSLWQSATSASASSVFYLFFGSIARSRGALLEDYDIPGHCYSESLADQGDDGLLLAGRLSDIISEQG